MNSEVCKSEHDFALVLTGISKVAPEAENALFDAGCSDATLSIRAGRVFLTFSRNAESLKDAILTAIQDVCKANIGADVLRVDTCNLVRGPGSFPAPVCDITEGAPLWYWCEVAYWLWQNDMIKEDVLREAQEVAVINSFLELAYQRQIEPELTGEVERWFGCKPCGDA